MASVTLRQVWLALATDLSDPVVAYSTGFAASGLAGTASPGTDVRTGQGQVRVYANGRVRNVVAAGMQRSLSVTLRALNYATCLTLEGWINQTVLFRDRVGRKAWCVFNGVQFYDYKGTDLHDATLTLTEVSYSEAV